ncbi:MAG: DNA polymerase III subunit gamma/tau [Bryobacterales bacterium]|nr:DNA polymerase III subunit gamma/tau [Bryobacterales bacterium]
MYQVFARKYRPQTFAELVGQEHVRTTLANAITQARIAHGYIFSGQRGTGKTTVARVLARCLNCEQGPTATPCMQCAACIEVAAGNAMDVIEIDAASNRGINEMRELRENVRFRPARDRYKVFIVDEAHQITNEAFNALLKTLEEPPEWVVFILCTTESHKIPTTIASRCQQFSFRSVDFTELVARMQWICEQEGLTAEPDALAVIAQVGEGSVRDSLSALDQAVACCGNSLTAADVRQLLGLFSLDSMGEVAAALAAQDSRRMLELVQELERNGRNLQHFCRELSRYFRNLLVAKIAGAGSRLIAASTNEQERLAETASSFSEADLTRYLKITLDLYKDLQYSLQPRLHLEIGLLRLVHATRLTSIEDALAALDSPGAPIPVPAAAKASAPRPQTTAPLRVPAPQPVASPPPPAAAVAPPASGSLKDRLLGHLQQGGNLLLADAVEHSEVSESGGEVRFSGPVEFTLSFRDAGMKTAVQAVLGRPAKISFTAAASAAPPPAKAQPEDDEVSRRALSNPEVQRFQETFPNSQIRNVRNLRD